MEYVMAMIAPTLAEAFQAQLQKKINRESNSRLAGFFYRAK